MHTRLKFLLILTLLFPGIGPARGAEAERPNVIYIMADELGYYEPGFNGGLNIKTPNLDRMASEGIRFTNMFGGGCVCAPTRCCLLTGKHSGHTSVRSNGGGTALRAEEATLASILKPLGYATAGFGKWGCGGRDSTGVPEKHGFDLFFGYYDQVHAHTYYPPYLIRNSEEVPLEGNQGGSKGAAYSHYLIHDAAMRFIREHRGEPFFAYLPYTPPHGNFDIPDTDPAWDLYKDQPWPPAARRYAAMVTMVDRHVGEVLSLLKELGLDGKTLVLFSGDNGGADYFVTPEHPRGVHSANKHPRTGAEFRGSKGTLYEGGVRVPFIARWPGRISPGGQSGHLAYFPDILPTLAEVSGAQAPADVDGISLVPTLLGEAAAGRKQPEHEYLYWEMGSGTAIRQGDWRAVGGNAGWQLFDLGRDPSESVDLAKEHPGVLAKLRALATAAHSPAVEGTFSRTDRHERDRRAKSGHHDAPAGTASPQKPGALRRSPPPPVEGMIPREGWKIVRFSSENANNGKFARLAIDGDPSTLWHTRFAGTVAKPPHELVIDLGARKTIRGFMYLGRQDGGWNGSVKEVEFAVSDDPDRFEKPVVNTQLGKTKEPLVVPCAPTAGRYILFRALSEHGGGEFASVAELGVLGE